MAWLAKLDIAVIALGLPAFIALDVSVEAWGVMAGAWCAQRLIRGWAIRGARESDDPRTLVGLLAGSMVGRGWLVALSIFGCGMAFGDKAGLASALLAIAAFTVMFSTEMIFGDYEGEGSR
ncbi:MAG: hypothetical protein WCO96_08580 [Actinomycetes bacterium]|jgi:hypothetical protein